MYEKAFITFEKYVYKKKEKKLGGDTYCNLIPKHLRDRPKI